MEEIWKPLPLPPHDTNYQVSTLGRIRRMTRRRWNVRRLEPDAIARIHAMHGEGMTNAAIARVMHVSAQSIGYHLSPKEPLETFKILRLYLFKTGYLFTVVWTDGVKGYMPVHRAVAIAFHGPIPMGMEVNHKNGIRTDNRLANLEVVTHQQNMAHAFYVLQTPGLYTPKKRGSAHWKAKLTEQDIVDIRRKHANGYSPPMLLKEYKINKSSMYNILAGNTWKHVPLHPESAIQLLFPWGEEPVQLALAI